MKFTKIVLFLSLCSLTISEVRRKYNLPYCTNESIGIYKLSDPGRCTTGANSTRQIKPIKVYKPFNRDVKMTGVACREKLEKFNCILFFFGGKQCTLVGTTYTLVDRKTCALAYQRHYTAVGSLLPESPNSFTTRNILKPSYRWPTSKIVNVRNFQLSIVTIMKDIVSKEYRHISMGTLRCNEKVKSCSAGSWRINYFDPAERPYQG